MITQTCVGCSALIRAYPSKPRRYCSNVCYSKNKQPFRQIEKSCPRCNKPFTTTAARDQRYCSRSCAKFRNSIDKNCLYCGNPIPRAKPSYIEKRDFCSRNCAKAHWSARISEPLTCQWCGKVYGTGGPKTRRHRKFCTITCASRAAAERRTVKRSARIIHLQRGRKAGRVNLPQRCAICGWADAAVDAAHLDSNHVVMLCPNHHRMLDRDKLPLATVESLRTVAIEVHQHDNMPLSMSAS